MLVNIWGERKDFGIEPTADEMKLHDAYVIFIQESTVGMMKLLTSPERRTHLARVQVPLDVTEFVRRIRELNAERLAKLSSKMLAGYEARKKFWEKSGLGERVLAHIQDKYED